MTLTLAQHSTIWRDNERLGFDFCEAHDWKIFVRSSDDEWNPVPATPSSIHSNILYGRYSFIVEHPACIRFYHSFGSPADFCIRFPSLTAAEKAERILKVMREVLAR